MKLERACNKILVILSASVLIPLGVLSFLQTQRLGEVGEIENGCPIYWEWDNPLWHILGIALAALLMMAGGVLKGKRGWKGVRFAAAVVSAALALLIYGGGIRTPEADQIQVYGAAMCFLRGEYINLSPGGYIEMYPQQLGYVSYLQVLFRIFGREDFRIVQVINCLLIGGIQYCINGITELLTEDMRARLLSEALTVLCLPLFLLGSWVYGDLPSYFFAAITAGCFIRLHVGGNRMAGPRRAALLCGMLAASVAAVLFRKNMWILILALAIAECIYAMAEKQWKNLAAVLAVLLLSAAVEKGVEYHYEAVSGYQVEGLPAVMWVAMGMIEGESKPGWFNNFSVPVYYESGCDGKASAKRAFEEIGMRAEYFVENPLYALGFYKRKVATQWNDPFLGTVLLIGADKGEPLKGVSAWILARRKEAGVFLSVWQNILYLGAVLYCVLAAGRKALPENMILIYFVGGFLFSVLWEANSRYIMPYVLLIIPYSAMGWRQFWDRIPVRRLKRQSCVRDEEYVL